MVSSVFSNSSHERYCSFLYGDIFCAFGNARDGVDECCGQRSVFYRRELGEVSHPQGTASNKGMLGVKNLSHPLVCSGENGGPRHGNFAADHEPD